MNKIYLFGYGSLVNKDNAKITNNNLNLKSWYKANIKGFKREWNIFNKNSKMSAVGLIKDKKSETNGVLIELLDKKWLIKFDKREEGYHRELIDNNKVITDINLDKTDKVYYYINNVNNVIKPSKTYPICLSYLDVILDGYMKIGGEKFVLEFIRTTKKFYSYEIYDDRINPRYPRYLKDECSYNYSKKDLISILISFNDI